MVESPEINDAAATFLRGEIRDRAYRRVSHGLFARKDPELSAEELFRQDLQAWLLVLPEKTVFTHVTAARLLGWQLPNLPADVPVFAAVGGNPNRPRRPGLICSRLVREHEPGMVHGLPIDRAEEILLRAARDLGLIDLCILLDSARRLGHINIERMELMLASRRPGVRGPEAWEHSHQAAESAGETVLRLFHQAIEVTVTPQVELFDDTGALLGRADLMVEGTDLLHEYDGAVHRTPVKHRADLRRDRGLRNSRYQRSGFTLDDLLNRAQVTMHEIDRVLRRPHDARRLVRWRRLIENSLYGTRGRERILNRWRRSANMIDWS